MKQSNKLITIPEEVLNWRLGDDTGTSSLLIWHTLTGIENNSRYTSSDTPCDVSDFGRCYRLLEIMPSWKDSLYLVSNKYPHWEPMVRNWSELSDLYSKGADESKAQLNEMIRNLRSLGRG